MAFTTRIRTGLAAAFLRNQPTFTPFAYGIPNFNVQAYLKQNALAMRQPPKLEGRDVQAVSIAPVSSVPSDAKPAKTADAEPKKSLFQTLTQRKVLIAAGAVLGVVALGGAAAVAYSCYPVATAAYAAAVGNAGRAAVINTHQLFIQPGLANTLFMANLAMKAAIIPAAQITLPVLLPVISTAIVTTLGTLVLICVANKVWIVAKAAAWSAGSAVANKFGNELDKTYVGTALKTVVVTTVAQLVEEEKDTVDIAKIMPALKDREESEVEMQPLLQIAGSQEVDETEAERIETLQAKNNQSGKSAKSSWMRTVLTASAIAAGVGAGIYFLPKMPDMDFINI